MLSPPTPRLESHLWRSIVAHTNKKKEKKTIRAVVIVFEVIFQTNNTLRHYCHIALFLIN